MRFSRSLFAAFVCFATLEASADCFVKSGLDFMEDQKSVGVVECSGGDSLSRRNVAVAMARTKLSNLTAANFEHTIAEDGDIRSSDQFISGFAGSARVVKTENVGGNVRYTVEANLDDDLRERMVEGMTKFI